MSSVSAYDSVNNNYNFLVIVTSKGTRAIMLPWFVMLGRLDGAQELN